MHVADAIFMQSVTIPNIFLTADNYSAMDFIHVNIKNWKGKVIQRKIQMVRKHTQKSN